MSDDRAGRARAFIDGCAILDLSKEVRILRVTGSDAFDYLQRMLSADLRRVTEGTGTHATLLTGKGKLIAAFDVHRDADGFLLLVERAAADELIAQLERLIILENVSVEDVSGEWALVTVQGPAARSVLEKALSCTDPPEAELSWCAVAGETARLVRRRRSPAGGWDLVIAARDRESCTRRLHSAGGVIVGIAEWDAIRIEAGIPRFGVDMTADNLPPEAGLSDAVSYDKGCYAGQEVLARIRTYGHVNKHLVRVRLHDASVPGTGDRISIGGVEAGQVTSGALSPIDDKGIALGYVRHKLVQVGAAVDVEVEGRKVPGVVEPLDPAPAE